MIWFSKTLSALQGIAEIIITLPRLNCQDFTELDNPPQNCIFEPSIPRLFQVVILK